VPKFNKYHILTIFSLGLFFGFWLGFFVFSQVRIKIICYPSQKVLLDVRRNLRGEFELRVNTFGCESIGILVEKPNVLQQIIERGGVEEMSKSKGNESKPANKSVETEISSLPYLKENKTFPVVLQPKKGEPQNASKVLTLKIFDACSRETASYLTLLEGLTWCINLPYPYYIVLKKNQTHMLVSFRDQPYSEILAMNESLDILRLFVEDVSTIVENINGVEVYGNLSGYFDVGKLTIDRVWETDKKGVMQITKTVLSFPLIVNSHVPYTNSWEELRFYLNLTSGEYFVGNVYVRCEEL